MLAFGLFAMVMSSCGTQTKQLKKVGMEVWEDGSLHMKPKRNHCYGMQ